MKPISVADVSRRFGSFTAVQDVTLEVEAGEVVGLVGANGAGKTTLMRMILGLLEPTTGTIRLFGEPQSREQRRRVGYVPQNLGLYRDLTVRENLDFRARAFSLPEAPEVALPDHGLVADLPLGIQRRVAFIAAIQHDPELLILDEPTSGVSPLSRSVLWNLIRERAESGVAVLVSTHYMDEAEQADRVALMSRGRLAAEGSANDIIGDGTVVEVASGRWEQAFEVLDGSNPLLTVKGTTIRVVGEGEKAVAGQLASAGIDAVVRTVPATLDETMVLLDS